MRGAWACVVVGQVGCRLGFDAVHERSVDATAFDGAAIDAACPVTATLDQLDCAPRGGCPPPPSCAQLVTLLHFDRSPAHGETATLAHDFSGAGNDVTCTGSTCPTHTTGRFGGGYAFDGLDVLEAADSPSLDAVDGVTLSVWFRPTMTSPDFAPLVTRWMPGVGDSNYRLAQNGDVFYVNFGVAYNWQNHATPTGYASGVWYHVVGTIDDNANRVRIWIDGALATDVASALDSEARPGKLWIGWAPEENGVVGLLDEIAVWTRVLSDQEIAALY